jgi:hypothetical protein
VRGVVGLLASAYYPEPDVVEEDFCFSEEAAA